MGVVIHPNGWPGSGKLTIARELAARLDARVIDSHTLLNPSEALYERHDLAYGTLRREVRELIFSHLWRMDQRVPLIFTDALSDDAWDTKMFDEYRALASARRARLVSVVLQCSEEENERRLVSQGRAAQQKLTRISTLRHLRENYRLLRPAEVECYTLDVSVMTVDDAAGWIVSSAGLSQPERRMSGG